MTMSVRGGVLVAAFTMCLIGVAGCGGGGKNDAAPHAGSGQQAAAPGVLCAAHGVLEPACAGCHPALAAIYQAKGDWCSEHGLAESFCPQCNPQRGGMPVGMVSTDEPPADGTRVRLATAETAQLVGLRAEAAVAGDAGSELVVTARIVYDAAKRAEVNARLSGVVRVLHVDIGTRVRAGSALAELESAGVGAERSRLQAARARVETAVAQHARSQQLYAEGIAAEKDVQAAQQELEAARADLAAAQSALGVVGTSEDGAGRYTLRSPIAGVVTRSHAALGRLVETQDVLFEIVDTSTMWAEIDIPELDVARVAAGDRVVVVVGGLADREFIGRIDWVAPEIDPRTRTAMGRVALVNPDGVLRANMFARARILITVPRKAVLVPHGALQRARTANLVFVCLGPGLYEARRVQVGATSGAWVEVAGRVAPGDSVVTAGSFLLKTETLKESIGAGCCEPGAPAQ